MNSSGSSTTCVEPSRNGALVTLYHPAPVIDRQAPGGDRPTRDVATQAFQLAALVRFAHRGRMQAEAVPAGQHGNIRHIRWHAVKGQRLAPCMRTDCDPVIDRSCLQMVQLVQVHIQIEGRAKTLNECHRSGAGTGGYRETGVSDQEGGNTALDYCQHLGQHSGLCSQ